MECIEGCGEGKCRKDRGCPRVVAMAEFVRETCQGGHTTTIQEIVEVGGIDDPGQWRHGFRDAVAELLGIRFVTEQGRVNGKGARAVRQITIFPTSDNNVGEIPLDESNPWGLTPREEAMLDLVAGGRDHAAIADELSISAKTVRNRLCLLRQRLEKEKVIENLPDSDALAQAYKYTYGSMEE